VFFLFELNICRCSDNAFWARFGFNNPRYILKARAVLV